LNKVICFILLHLATSHYFTVAVDNLQPKKPNLNVAERLENRLIKVVFEPFQQTVISSEVEGKILSIPHKLGDAVDENALLVKLDDRRAKSAYEKAIAELEQLEQTSEAVEELYRFGDESRINLVQAQTNAKVKKIESDYAKINFESTTITSPFAGRIAELMVEEYENVEKGKPLLKLIDTSKSKGKPFFPITSLIRSR
jgi:multidrug resistance efflux pump